MEVLIPRCAGLDVHQETIVACVFIGEADETPRTEIRTFRKRQIAPTCSTEMRASLKFMVGMSGKSQAMTTTRAAMDPAPLDLSDPQVAEAARTGTSDTETDSTRSLLPSITL